jgi:hypothetical protein
MLRLTTHNRLANEGLLNTAGLFLKYTLLVIGVGFLLAVLVYALTGTRTIVAFAGQWWASSILMSITMGVSVLRYRVRFGLAFVAIHAAMYWLWFQFLPNIINAYSAIEPSFMKWWHN